MNTYSQTLAALHDASRTEAEKALSECGFNLRDGEWFRHLNVADGRAAEVRVSIPSRFPDALLDVYVDLDAIQLRVFNCDRTGKLCLAPQSGVLIDANNPTGIVRDSVERAKGILARTGTNGEIANAADEFINYWDASESQLCICNPDGETRSIQVIEIDKSAAGTTVPYGRSHLVADDLSSADHWLSAVGLQRKHQMEGFFLRLEERFLPPRFGEAWKVENLLPVLRGCCSPKDLNACQTWLNASELPRLLVLAVPTVTSGRALVAVQLPEISPTAFRAAKKGFRPHRVPRWRQLEFSRKAGVFRYGLDRLDHSYMTGRAGAADSLMKKKVIVVGCGAVGSHLADQLCSLGIGHLLLVDHDSLESGNVHRHLLGVDDVGKNKARAVADLLQRKYPHFKLDIRGTRIETLLDELIGSADTYDLIAFSTGDETLERRMNELLGYRIIRVHTWVDPLSLGGGMFSSPDLQVKRAVFTVCTSRMGILDCTTRPRLWLPARI